MTNLSRRRFTLSASAVASIGLWSRRSLAQTPWPNPTKITLPFVAGGGVDANIRKLADPLRKALGAAVVIENKAGAGGLIAVKSVSTAPPDGSSILYVSASMLDVQALGADMDLLNDLTMVTKVTVSPHVLVVNAKSPFKTQADLIAAAQAKPGKLNYATGGSGSNTHLMYETFKVRVPGGFDATNIPYKSVAAGVVGILAGEIDFAFILPSAVLPLIRSGEVRALACTGNRRLKIMPDVPTVAELGMPGYFSAPWGGFALPKNTPQALVDRLYTAIKAVYSSPDMVSYFESVGADISISSSPANMVAELRAELEAEKALLKRLNIKAS